MIDLVQAKKDAKIRFQEIALKYTPSEIDFIFIRKGLRGSANARKRCMAVPKPFTRKSLYIFLHECAHIVLGHNDKSKKHRYQEELEAEQWTHRTMRFEGVPVPRAMTRNARNYVFRKLHQARVRGLKKSRITKSEVRFR